MNRTDLIGALVIYAGRADSGEWDLGWDWFSTIVMQRLKSLASTLNAFDGKDIYGESCTMKVATTLSSGASLASWQYVASPGAGYISGPDYGLLWTKYQGTTTSGGPIGITRSHILSAKQPRCSLCWAGTYLPLWLNREGLSGESWIHAQSTSAGGGTANASAEFMVEHAVRIINSYNCCKEDEDGNAWIFRASYSASETPEGSGDYRELYPVYPAAKWKLKACEGCPRTSTKFKCRER